MAFESPSGAIGFSFRIKMQHYSGGARSPSSLISSSVISGPAFGQADVTKGTSFNDSGIMDAAETGKWREEDRDGRAA
jgi:hypothetical protein